MNNQTHNARCSATGTEFPFTIRTESHGDTDVIGEVYTHDTYNVARMTLPDNALVFDIGAHIGTASVLLKQRFPTARIVAVEPNPRSFELLQMNTAGFEGVTTLNAAVSYQENVVLTDGRGATGGGFLTTREAFEAARAAKEGMDGFLYSIVDTEVQTLTFEDLLERYGVPDLIKWDCEGGEVDAFKHMTDASAALCGDMVGEYHIEGGMDAFQALAASRFPHHRFEGRGDTARPIGWFRMVRAGALVGKGDE